MSQFFKKVLPRPLFDKLKNAIAFRPEHHTNMVQVLPQKLTGFEGTPIAEHIKGHRYPAPGSHHTASVPVRDDPDSTYDTKAYVRNASNLPFDEEILINATEPVALTPQGQYGDRTYGNAGKFGKPAVELYDPTGLRATMNATWPAMDAALQKQAAHDHNVRFEWHDEEMDIQAECDRKNIPYTEGRRYKAVMVGRNYNEVRW